MLVWDLAVEPWLQTRPLDRDGWDGGQQQGGSDGDEQWGESCGVADFILDLFLDSREWDDASVLPPVLAVSVETSVREQNDPFSSRGASFCWVCQCPVWCGGLCLIYVRTHFVYVVWLTSLYWNKKKKNLDSVHVCIMWGRAKPSIG